jgi:small conductance mechanosensitive channel
LVFGIGCEESVETAQEALAGIVAAHPELLADPAASIRVCEPGERSVTFSVRPRVRAGDYRDVCRELTQSAKAAFGKHGQAIPVPQTGMRIRAGPEGNPSVFTPA